MQPSFEITNRRDSGFAVVQGFRVPEAEAWQPQVETFDGRDARRMHMASCEGWVSVMGTGCAVSARHQSWRDAP